MPTPENALPDRKDVMKVSGKLSNVKNQSPLTAFEKLTNKGVLASKL